LNLFFILSVILDIFDVDVFAVDVVDLESSLLSLFLNEPNKKGTINAIAGSSNVSMLNNVFLYCLNNWMLLI
jgi:hypothetical protein